MAIDPVPAITEAEASGETAEIYADIRATLGIGVVNLIWRHLATMEGALPWVWGAIKPVYVSGSAAREAGDLFDGLNLPEMPLFPPSALRLAGVSDADRETVIAVLDSYNRGNSLNLIALATLSVKPSGEAPSASGKVIGAVEKPIPGLPSMDALEPDVRDLVLALSELGAGPTDRIIPSMYRHLAGWPGFLGLSWSVIAPLHHDGRLKDLMARGWDAAHTHAGRIAGEVSAGAEPSSVAEARAAIEEFKRTAISRMVPVAMIIRRMMG
ncbi:MAG: hypothetical protein P8N43_06455 [Alphaproteobacteria bacterium]|nr:hypothetical protein [Alphaproteobacteria bacterium]